jgi:hypothetical protein
MTSSATSFPPRDCATIGQQKAKAITSIAMFYDHEDPAAFVADVAEALAENGIWVIELHYLPTMLKANAFDAIVHEHLEYYTLAVIERLIGEGGLRSSRQASTTSTAARSACASAITGPPADARAGRRASEAARRRVRARARVTSPPTRSSACGSRGSGMSYAPRA